MEIVGLAFAIAAFVAGFIFATRHFTNVLVQLIVGAALGFAIIGAVGFTFLGVAFAGCLCAASGVKF